ncbi:hypothetical protein Q9966_005062 [Columba livia]|nr:hypothetical protein Q9966_005062 [Columba livia]
MGSMRFGQVLMQGHSHQVFHVCGIVGTHFQLEAILTDVAERQGRLLPPSPLPSALQTLGSMGVCAVVSLAVIGRCSLALRFLTEPLPREKPHGH